MAARFTRRDFMQAGLIASASMAWSPFSFANTNTTAWPNRPVRIVVPYAPGGATDVVARLIGEGLKNHFNQVFLVENRSGAGGTIGTANVAASAPDGYTLNVGLSSSLMINQFQYKNLSYDPRKDLQLVSLLAYAPVAFCVPIDMPVNNMAEFEQYVADNKKNMSYGSYGNGSYSHMILEHLNRSLQAQMPHIAYRGEVGVIQALMGNEVQIGVSSAVNAGPQVAAGSIKAIGIVGNQRLDALPHVPTMIEQGYTDPAYEIVGWIAMAAPANTPKDVVQRLSEQTNKLLQTEELKTKLATLGLLAEGTTPEDFENIYNSQFETWKTMFENSGASVIE